MLDYAPSIAISRSRRRTLMHIMIAHRGKIIVLSTCRTFIFPWPTCRSYLEKYRPISSLSAIDILLVVKSLDVEVIIV
jgi:hypothetical protein